MRIPYGTMISEFECVLRKKGFGEDRARAVATIFVQNSLAGVYSHGLNRSPRVVEYLEKSEIDPDIVAEYKLGLGAFERWNRRRRFGPLGAKPAIDRACELTKEYGIDLATLGGNNRRMRGGSYGFQAVDQGCIGICWSNTCPNMPTWGGKDRKIGNDPIIFAVFRSNGQHVVINRAVSQSSHGRIGDCRLKGIELLVPGGYGTEEKLAADPAEIKKTWRVPPMDYWKGSRISIALDLIAAILTNGNSMQTIRTFGDETGLTQAMITINPARANSVELTDEIVDQIAADVKSSELVEEGRDVLYPGEPEALTIQDNLANGIPVIEEKWNQALTM